MAGYRTGKGDTQQVSYVATGTVQATIADDTKISIFFHFCD